jgi:hypothetical protein
MPNGEIGMIISGIYRLMKHPFLEINYACPRVDEKCVGLLRGGVN